MSQTKHAPSEAQKRLATILAAQRNVRLPHGYSVREDVCSQFINEHKLYLKPSEAQLSYARAIAAKLGLDIHYSFFLEYTFCKRFLDLFAGKTENDEWTGLRRVQIIESYLSEDKELEHLQFKLDLNTEDVMYMRKIIVEFKYGGNLMRADDQSRGDAIDPEEEYYRKANRD